MHEHLAKSLLVEKLDGDISIEQVARACNLSRGDFIRAFRETTGMTPYQWLLSQRIDRARALLRTSNAPLAEVAWLIKAISQGFSLVWLVRRLAIGGVTCSALETKGSVAKTLCRRMKFQTTSAYGRKTSRSNDNHPVMHHLIWLFKTASD
nr:helix-turn-helix transcriptional regulator [Agrobacterium vitis]